MEERLYKSRGREMQDGRPQDAQSSQDRGHGSRWGRYQSWDPESIRIAHTGLSATREAHTHEAR